ncbi:hypothetical protein JB92DRAFT_2885811 [Gautieria morchelliformis]|nr:hypothetical protein JB92DRAFT_2885811 [Gautieria morchelliformis]
MIVDASSATPLVAHGVTESGISQCPQAINSLPLWKACNDCHPLCGLLHHWYCTTNISMGLLVGPNRKLVGWYHGIISLHDLRCPMHSDSSERGPILPPCRQSKTPSHCLPSIPYQVRAHTLPLARHEAAS